MDHMISANKSEDMEINTKLEIHQALLELRAHNNWESKTIKLFRQIEALLPGNAHWKFTLLASLTAVGVFVMGMHPHLEIVSINNKDSPDSAMTLRPKLLSQFQSHRLE
jgi:hypothetical protein